MAMWFSPFVITACLHLLVGGPALLAFARRASARIRYPAGAALGYLAAFAALYVLYQGYYGNLLAGRDGSVAAAVSDPALLGIVPGLFAAWWLRRDATAPPQNGMAGWFALWLLVFLSVSISGWGRGWFLRFGPQRLEVFLWLPLCYFTARGLGALPRMLARPAWAGLVGCGAVSVLVAVFAFQGPYARMPALAGEPAGPLGPWPALHPEVMQNEERQAMQAVERGPVLALPPASDLFALQLGLPVVFGVGSFNLTDVPYTAVRADAQTFFTPGTPAAVRREIVRTWCATSVYCDGTWHNLDAVVGELKQTPWLRLVAEAPNGAALFRVQDSAGSSG